MGNTSFTTGTQQTEIDAFHAWYRAKHIPSCANKLQSKESLDNRPETKSAVADSPNDVIASPNNTISEKVKDSCMYISGRVPDLFGSENIVVTGTKFPIHEGTVPTRRNSRPMIHQDEMNHQVIEQNKISEVSPEDQELLDWILDCMKRNNLMVISTSRYNHLINNRDVTLKQDKRKDILYRSVSSRPDRETFMDSTYIKSWLSEMDAWELFFALKNIGDKHKPPNIASASKSKTRYPLWSSYYGSKRPLDGALALDRWGSNHESWLRTEEPPLVLEKICEKLRKEFNMTDDCMNSMLVNYYYDGASTWIPAHRDTTACLKEGSDFICMSLGASRKFVICSNDDAGKYEYDEMTIEREWNTHHGDIFIFGPKTNDAFCHAVTKDNSVDKMRISIIFRTVSKSFLDLNASPKEVVYANGTMKQFQAECIVADNIDDPGQREHISDLIQFRENKKKEKSSISPSVSEEMHIPDKNEIVTINENNASLTDDKEAMLNDNKDDKDDTSSNQVRVVEDIQTTLQKSHDVKDSKRKNPASAVYKASKSVLKRINENIVIGRVNKVGIIDKESSNGRIAGTNHNKSPAKDSKMHKNDSLRSNRSNNSIKSIEKSNLSHGKNNSQANDSVRVNMKEYYMGEGTMVPLTKTLIHNESQNQVISQTILPTEDINSDLDPENGTASDDSDRSTSNSNCSSNSDMTSSIASTNSQ